MNFFSIFPLPIAFNISNIEPVLSDYGWLAQLVEQLTLNQRVAGSTPASSTKYQTERQGIANTKASDKAKRFWKRKWNLTNFETATFDFCKDIAEKRPKNFGWLAQLVEQLTLNQRVAGSTPASSTKHHLNEMVFLLQTELVEGALFTRIEKCRNKMFCFFLDTNFLYLTLSKGVWDTLH